MAKTYLVGFRRRELGKWSSYEDFKGIPTKVSHCRFMIYKKLELDWTFVFRVRDRFSQNYKMRTWSGFRMTHHIYMKVHVPWSHSIREKCDAILQNFKVVYWDNCATFNFCKLSSHFSQKWCPRGRLNFFV